MVTQNKGQRVLIDSQFGGNNFTIGRTVQYNSICSTIFETKSTPKFKVVHKINNEKL